MDHHYLPVFLLKQWAGQDGKVAVFRRVDRGSRVRYFHPRGVAYEKDLLAFTRDLGSMEKQFLETRLFGEVDTRAAPVRERLVAKDPGSLTPVERDDWAKFLISLQLRQPPIVDFARAAGSGTSIDSLTTLTEAERAILDEARVSGGLVEFLEARSPGLAENFGLALYPDLLNDPVPRHRLMNMIWRIADISRAKHRLMISDAPCLLHQNISHDRFLWALPISPTQAFFAIAAERDEDAIQRAGPNEVVRALNQQSLTQARQRVFALDGAQARFVQNRWAAPLSDSAQED